MKRTAWLFLLLLPISAAAETTILARGDSGQFVTLAAGYLNTCPKHSAWAVSQALEKLPVVTGFEETRLVVEDNQNLLLVCAESGQAEQSLWIIPKTGETVIVDLAGVKKDPFTVLVPPDLDEVSITAPFIAGVPDNPRLSFEARTRQVRAEDGQSLIKLSRHQICWLKINGWQVGRSAPDWYQYSSAADPEFLPGTGDVNLDGRITVIDAVTILKAVIGLETLPPGLLFLADAAAPEGVTVADVVTVLRRTVL